MKILAKRTHWMQRITDLRQFANTSGLTKKEAKIAKKIFSDIPQYRCAAKVLARTGWYTVSHLDFSQSLYRWENNRLVHIATTTKHRIAVIQSAYKEYKNGKIDSNIWNNYCTGGYTTRIGLYRANEQQNKIDRTERISRSHADYDDQTYTGETGHQLRVYARN